MTLPPPTSHLPPRGPQGRALHILHLIARLNDGGPARVLAGLAPALTRLGHTVEIISGRCADDERELAGWVRSQGVAVTLLPELGKRLDPLADLAALRRIRALIAARRPHLVHTHTAKAGALGRLACRSLGQACLHTYHGHVLHGYFGRAGDAAVHRVEQALAGNAWHHALTPGQMTELRDRFAIGRPGRWRWLPVPVPPVPPAAAEWHARLRPGLPTVLFLGRLVPVKDPLLWLDALAALARLRPVQGLVCGDGPLRLEAEARARALGVPVLFTGAVPAGQALGAAAALLMTSRNEGQPLAAVEAAGAGLPVVAPPVGGLADLVRWGMVHGAAREPSALAAALAPLLDRPRAPHPLALAFAPDRLAARYARLYAEISHH